MTKKDYILIADAIRDYFSYNYKLSRIHRTELINCFEFKLYAQNSRFNSDKFEDYINKQ